MYFSRDIVVIKGMTTEISCNFQMQWYPFDSQTCYLEIQLQGTDVHFAQLIPNYLTYKDSYDVQQYRVEDVCFVKKGEKSSVWVQIRFQRQIITRILTNILPTILINIICLLANYYLEDIFDVIIMINLTGLLVMTTLFNDET